MALACGIVTGGQCWGISAAIGLGAAIVLWPSTFFILRIVGGGYLLWLAFRAARLAMAGIATRLPTSSNRFHSTSLWPHYLRGFGIQITNPKAILVWMTTITLGLSGNDAPWAGFIVVAGCLIIGLLVFSTYALVFSSTRVVEVYGRISSEGERWHGTFFCFSRDGPDAWTVSNFPCILVIFSEPPSLPLGLKMLRRLVAFSKSPSVPRG
jgi:threonine/homoserine/homoserine lactone efflux protein